MDKLDLVFGSVVVEDVYSSIVLAKFSPEEKKMMRRQKIKDFFIEIGISLGFAIGQSLTIIGSGMTIYYLIQSLR